MLVHTSNKLFTNLRGLIDKSKGNKLGPPKLAMSLKYQCQQISSAIDMSGLGAATAPDSLRTTVDAADAVIEAAKEKVAQLGQSSASTKSESSADGDQSGARPPPSKFFSSEFIYRHDYPDAFDAAASSVHRDSSSSSSSSHHHGKEAINADSGSSGGGMRQQRPQDAEKREEMRKV